MLIGLDVYLLFGLRNSMLSKGEEAHHEFKGRKSASMMGIICAFVLIGLSMLDYFLKNRDFVNEPADNTQPSFPWFFVILAIIQIAIFSMSLMKKPKTA